MRRGADGGLHIATPQVHRRHHVLLRRMRRFGREDRRQRVGANDALGERSRTPCRVARAGDNRKHRLAEVAQRVAHATGQDRVVFHQRAAFVVTGDVGGHEHVHDTGLAADEIEVDRLDDTVRQRRHAERGVQGAHKFWQVVGVGRTAGHMQVGGLVRVAAADLRKSLNGGLSDGRFGGQIDRLVQTAPSRANTLTALSGKGASARVSNQKRRNRFCAT